MATPFYQDPPQLTNTYTRDTALKSHLTRLLDPATLEAITPELETMGEQAAGPMIALARQAETHPPTLTQYGPYGRRIDHIELSHGWKEISRIAAAAGLIDIPYARAHGWQSRVHQAALLHLFTPSSAYVSCPLAMSDGAVAALTTYGGDAEWATRAIHHLRTRDPDQAWTSGQWMTEKEGGSDVGRSSTTARFDGQHWRLYGTKWFTSATTSECTLGLARPEGAGAGSRSLALFYIEPWNADGTSNHIRVRRLKDKLGTKALPTAELDLEGAVAHPVGDVTEPGLRKIATVLNIARYFNANSAVSFMRRDIDLALAYAQVREAFGHRIIDLPLHAETLADLQVEYEGALAVGLRLAELLGKVECGVATDIERATWRLLTPLAKLGTGKQVVHVASETLEAFGGAGYIEDTDIPRLLRDAQVLPIWEGTTNVLSLDALRAIERENALEGFMADIAALTHGLDQGPLAKQAALVDQARGQLGQYALSMARGGDAVAIQLGARRFALSLYRTYAAALLCRHAAWDRQTTGSQRSSHVAARWIAGGLTSIASFDASRVAENLELLG